MANYLITVPSGVTGGTFSLSADGTETGQITAPGTASGVQSALRAIAGDGVTVTGSNGGPFTVSGFTGTLAVGTSSLEGTTENVSVTTVTDVNLSAGGSITMAGTTFEDLREAKGKLIRKALGGLILVADMDAEVPENIMADPQGNLIDFKALGYRPVGWLTKSDGINFTRETENSEVESFGAQEPTRIDIIKDATSAAFTCQETNRQVLEMYYAKDLSDLTMDENGEFGFTPDANPETTYRRMIYIAKDGNGENAKYIAKIMPKAMVSETSEQGWSSESELSYGLTVKASQDDELRWAVKHKFGGPGFLKLAEDMGIPVAGAVSP